ncbi:MAG: DUF4112 domain-containing protein [Gemmatimonadota bacterium]
MNPQLPDRRLGSVRALANALDSAIGVPGTSLRIGLDPVLGLIPGFGDVAGAALSGYIVLTGIRLGASRAVVLRMLGNVAIDTVVGSVPLLGDLFDAGWKSNSKNVALLEQYLEAPVATRAGSRALLIVVFAVLLVLAAAGAALTFVVLRALIQLLS